MKSVDCENICAVDFNTDTEQIETVCSEHLANSEPASYLWHLRINREPSSGSFWRGFSGTRPSLKVDHLFATQGDDDHAIAEDWAMVGNDIVTAVLKFHSNECERGGSSESAEPTSRR